MAVKFYMWTFLVIVIIIETSLATPLSSPSDPNPLQPDPNDLTDTTHPPRVRRQYYVCPPDFKRVSNNCYYFSKNQATWQDAHYDCRDRQSELAVITSPAEDRKLRGQLNRSVKPVEWWIGGIYDWEQMKWKWVSGKKFEYHGFSRMGPEDKEKLKWHCAIMAPKMKYKWNARSCVIGKHYICQKTVMKVNKKKLDKLRKEYNNTLNEIPAPIYYKPRKHENQANGNSNYNLKNYLPNGQNLRRNKNAFGRRNNTELVRNAKKERRNRNKEERRKRKRNMIRINGKETYNFLTDDSKRNRKRNRRNKSKENNSLENATFSAEDLIKIKNKTRNREDTSMENLTPKTTYMTNTLSPLHPRVIVEEHDFMDLIPNNS